MWINGRDPISDGWTLTGISNWYGGLAEQRSTTSIPGVAAVLPGSQLSVSGARAITLTFTTIPGVGGLSSLTNRDTFANVLADLLSGVLWVRFDDAPTRVVRGEVTSLSFRSAVEGAAFGVPSLEATATLTCYDNASYDTEPRVVTLGTSPVEVPLGTLPSVGRISWGAAWTSATARTITLRDAGGVARYVMTFTAPAAESLSSTEFLEVDTGRRYVTKVTGAGLRTNEYDWYTSGGWLVLDPAWQARAATRFATLEVSAGTAQLVYRRAYAL